MYHMVHIDQLITNYKYTRMTSGSAREKCRQEITWTEAIRNIMIKCGLDENMVQRRKNESRVHAVDLRSCYFADVVVPFIVAVLVVCSLLFVFFFVLVLVEGK